MSPPPSAADGYSTLIKRLTDTGLQATMTPRWIAVGGVAIMGI